MEWTRRDGVTMSGSARCVAVIDGERCDDFVRSPSGLCIDHEPVCDCGHIWPWCECDGGADGEVAS